MALYDLIGNEYDTTRRADPEIVEMLVGFLKPAPEGCYVDFACGTANYTSALQRIAGHWSGIDVATKMLNEAHLKAPSLNLVQADISQLPYQSQCFHGGMCTLAMHHFDDIPKAVAEMYRVLLPSSPLVIFTAAPEQLRNYWLCDYFPEMMRKSWEHMPNLQYLNSALQGSGFQGIRVVPFDVTASLQDFFLYSGKYHPEMYLNAQVRNGISSFRNFCGEQELSEGLASLQRDIESGAIAQRIRQSQHPDGDYCFVVASKPAG